MTKIKRIQGYAFVICSAFLFGCMPLITKNIYAEGVNSLSVVFLRNALSVPVLAILTFWKDRSLKITPKSLLPISAIALTGCCITPYLLFSSYNYLASGTATVLHFVYPAAVVVAGMLFLRQRPHWGSLLSVLLCLIGIGTFYDTGTPLDPTGAVLAVVSGLAYAAYVILLSIYKPKNVGGFKLSLYISIVCTVVMAVFFLACGELTFPASLKGWVWCFLLAIVVNVGAVVLFQQGTFIIGGERAAILSTVEPITGVVIGAVVFDEIIGTRTAIGSVLVILASILIAVFDMQKSKKQ